MPSLLNCLIVDDEQKNCLLIENMLSRFYPDAQKAHSVSSVEQAVDSIKELKPNLVFLDIEMPGGNGFTLFEKIPNPDFMVIFTTAHAEYGVKAIKVAALDYLLKPINPDEFIMAIDRAVLKLREHGRTNGPLQGQLEVLKGNRASNSFHFKKIALPTHDGLEFIDVQDILKCQADRSYCMFYLTNGRRIMVSNSLKEYEDILNAAGFYRVHKSNMVNISHIAKYIRGKGGQVVLSDGSLVAVAVRKKDGLLKALSAKKTSS
jgi:two-component system, LytTR family, response regulator